ncbi:13278_t:CDS:2 [Entrophospora sp. SA101]|nr:13278_t:CDS:2 [Entrophospora sp. SA101]
MKHLPTELIIEIFKYIEIPISLILVNKEFCRICTSAAAKSVWALTKFGRIHVLFFSVLLGKTFITVDVKLGIGYEQLNKINPRLIYTSITGYGQTGPYANRAGYDVIIEAEAGLMHITGEENGQPVKVGVAITDITTGLYAHGAIMAALLLRQPNQEAKRLGTSHPSIVPYQVFQTKDDFIMIGTGNEKQFKILCESIDKVELMHDERFKTNSDRVQNRKELIEILKERFQEHTTEHWLLVFEKNKHSIPFSSINNIHKTFQHPQIVARKMVQEVEHPKAGKIKLTGAPVKYSGYKPTIRLPPPILGQHTHEEFIRRD